MISMSFKIRAMYLTILEFCNPTDPVPLFNRHRIEMAEDFSHQHRNATSEQLCAMFAMDLDCWLRAKNFSLRDFVWHHNYYTNRLTKCGAAFRVAALPLVRCET